MGKAFIKASSRSATNFFIATKKSAKPVIYDLTPNGNPSHVPQPCNSSHMYILDAWPEFYSVH